MPCRTESGTWQFINLDIFYHCKPNSKLSNLKRAGTNIIITTIEMSRRQYQEHDSSAVYGGDSPSKNRGTSINYKKSHYTWLIGKGNIEQPCEETIHSKVSRYEVKYHRNGSTKSKAFNLSVIVVFLSIVKLYQD